MKGCDRMNDGAALQRNSAGYLFCELGYGHVFHMILAVSDAYEITPAIERASRGMTARCT
jgi:hypothetical protein